MKDDKAVSSILSDDKNDKLTLYFITNDWSGLHDAFETEDWGKVAGVPLVPLYWKVLAEKGHRVHIFVTGDFSCDKDFVLEGINFHRRRIPDWLSGGVGRRTIRTSIKLFWCLHTHKCKRAAYKTSKLSPPDVIYSYGPGSNTAAYMLAKRFKVPFIAHYWGTWLGHYLFKVPWYKRLRVLPQILMLKLLSIDLLIISNDGTHGDKVVEALKFPREKFRFWLDGTSPDAYQPEVDKEQVKCSVGLEPSDKMIFQAARLDSWKRIDRAITAMPTIIRRVPNARLVIAGDGSLRGKLETQAKQLGVANYVKFLGFVPHDKVLKMHNAADLFLTVQDLTNLGNQILEALHSGTCIVAYNIGGTSEVMINEVTGVLLEQDKLHKLGDIISDLLLDDERRSRLAQGALSFARKKIWTWDERINAEIAEVRRLTAQNRPKIRKRASSTD